LIISLKILKPISVVKTSLVNIPITLDVITYIFTKF
jgi:hypothetical protein